jgi:hypothetical protein
MIDVALAIEALLPAAEYFGSTTANTKECFDDLNWQDSRTKPTWKQVQDAWVILEPQLLAEAEAKATAKATAEGKLAALGLTTDDLRALGL